MGSHKIILVDEHEIIRQRVNDLAGKQEDLDIVENLPGIQNMIRQTRLHQPDLLILSLIKPGRAHLGLIAGILQTCTMIKILIVSPGTHTSFCRQALQAGASGYVLSRTNDVDILNAIRVVINGAVALPLEMAMTTS